MISTTKKPIPFKDLTEENKGEWVELDTEDMKKIIDGLQHKEEEIQVDSSLNFHKTYDAEYYAMNFPGFDDFVYEILEQETINLNKELPTDGHWYYPEESLSEIKNRHLK
jgi:hypothetical protein